MAERRENKAMQDLMQKGEERLLTQIQRLLLPVELLLPLWRLLRSCPREASAEAPAAAADDEKTLMPYTARRRRKRRRRRLLFQTSD